MPRGSWEFYCGPHDTEENTSLQKNARMYSNFGEKA